MLWTDLSEMKRLLEIDPNDHSEDFTLNLYDEWVSSIFAEILNRDITYKVRTKVYPGTGNQKLLLNDRPVYPLAPPPSAATQPFQALTVTVDDGANYGQAPGAFSGPPLVYGVDYTLRVDQDDGSSREAILYRVNDYWTRPICRQAGMLSPFVGTDLGSIQVQSTAGYTVDTLPGILRFAADWLIARLRYIFPLGLQLSSESYIDRSIGINESQRNYLLGAVRPFLWQFRNWHW